MRKIQYYETSSFSRFNAVVGFACRGSGTKCGFVGRCDCRDAKSCVSTGEQNADSLVDVLSTEKPTANQRIDLLDKICKFYPATDLEKGIEYSKKGLKLAEKGNNKKMISTFNKYLGIGYYHKSSFKEYAKVLEYATEGLHIAEEFDNPRHIFGAYSSLADIYREMGRYKECEEMAIKSWATDSTGVEEGSLSALFLAIANIHLGRKENSCERIRLEKHPRQNRILQRRNGYFHFAGQRNRNNDRT